MTPKRDIFLHRNYYILRIKQIFFILLCILGIAYITAKHEFPSEAQHGVTIVIAIFALSGLLMKRWLFFLLCAMGLYFNVDENLPAELHNVRAIILAVTGILCVFEMELRNAKENFGLTFFPPGWGTLRPHKFGSSGRFLSLYEFLTKLRWKPGGILIGRPLPEHRLFGLFNFVKIGPPDDRHLLTIAGSRGGKGTAAIVPNLLLYPGSVIVIDPKGELARITAARRGFGSQRVKKSLGQEVFIFDPENNIPDYPSASWNPLAELDLNHPHLWAHVSKIATAIIPKSSVNDPNTEFFRNHARTLLTAIIMHVLDVEPSERHNLIYIRQLIMEGDVELYQNCIAEGNDYGDPVLALFMFMAQSRSHGGKIAMAINSFLTMASETRSGAITTLQEQTDFLDHPGLEQHLLHSDFTLRNFKQRGITIYLCIQATSLATNLVKILSIFIDLAMVELERDKNFTPKHRVLFIIDEFYALGRNETIDVGMGLFAGFHVLLWPILQNISQLKTHYPNNWQTFLANCRGVQLFNEQEPDTLKWLVEEKSGTRLEKRPDGTIEKVPLLSINALNSDYFLREDRRQIFVPQGRPIALLELMDYYRLFPKRWYSDLTENGPLNPNPRSLASPSRPVKQLPSPQNTHFTLNIFPDRDFKLFLGTRLSKSEIPELDSTSPDNSVIEINHHPNDPSIFGMKNLSKQSWKLFLPDGSIQMVGCGKSVKLTEGRKIDFGNVTGKIFYKPFILSMSNGQEFVLIFGKKLSNTQIPGLSTVSPYGVVAEVSPNPNNPNVLGLKNLSSKMWHVSLPNGNRAKVASKQSIVLVEGAQIDFGTVQAEIIN